MLLFLQYVNYILTEASELQIYFLHISTNLYLNPGWVSPPSPPLHIPESY